MTLGDLSPANLDDQEILDLVTVGTCRELFDFVRDAARVGHPRCLPFSGPELDDLVSSNLIRDRKELLDKRVDFCRRGRNRAKELQSAENET